MRASTIQRLKVADLDVEGPLRHTLTPEQERRIGVIPCTLEETTLEARKKLFARLLKKAPPITVVRLPRLDS
jgi:hypothetical protein